MEKFKKVKLGKIVEFINPVPVKKSAYETEYKGIFPANIVDGKIESFDYVEINLKKEVENKYFLQPGDVIFQVKGSNFEAVLIDEEHKGVLASNSYMILRVNSKEIEPKYLQWLLNTKTVLEHLDSKTSGAIIKIIRKSSLENLELIVPSLEKQQEIAEMILNFEFEKENFIKYIETKKKLIETVIMEKIGEVY